MKVKGEARSRAFDLACSDRSVKWKNDQKNLELKTDRYNSFRAIVAALSPEQKLFDDSELYANEEEAWAAQLENLSEADTVYGTDFYISADGIKRDKNGYEVW